MNEEFAPRQPDEESLYDWGYLVREGKERLPTRAAVALFGSLRGVRNLIPRPVLDVQFLSYATDEEMPETRSPTRNPQWSVATFHPWHRGKILVAVGDGIKRLSRQWALG